VGGGALESYSTGIYICGLVWASWIMFYNLKVARPSNTVHSPVELDPRTTGETQKTVPSSAALQISTVLLWGLGLLTTYLSSLPCDDPELLHAVLCCHVPLMVDIVALAETLVLVGIGIHSSGWQWGFWHLILGLVAVASGVLGVASSYGNLGGTMGMLVEISSWKYGLGAFVCASATRDFPVQGVIWMARSLRALLPPTTDKSAAQAGDDRNAPSQST
jgi:hypothetical protein